MVAPNLADIRAAAERIRPIVRRTPVLVSGSFNRATGLTAFHGAFTELGGCSPSRDFPLAAMQAYRRALGEPPVLTYSPRSAT